VEVGVGKGTKEKESTIEHPQLKVLINMEDK
jgi:hypothetical protein